MTPQVIPILPTPDPDGTAEFFSHLGFVKVAQFPNEYQILEHPVGIEIHFFKSPDLSPADNDHGCYVRFASAAAAESLHGQWAEADLSPGDLHPPTETAYGLLEFALLDQFRNLLRVGGTIA